MRDHKLPNFADHFAHIYDPVNGGTSDLILLGFEMDGYKEAGMHRNLNRRPSYLDYLSAMMYLHRTYLVEALTRYPGAPLSCKWGVSVYAVHRSALIIMVSFRRFYELYPNMIPKVLDIWMYVSGIPVLSQLLADPHRPDYFRICLSLCHRDSIPWMSVVTVFTSRDQQHQEDVRRDETNYDAGGEYISCQGKIYSLVARCLIDRYHAQKMINKLHEQAHTAFKAYQTGLWRPHNRSTGNSADQDEAEDGDSHVLRLAGASMLVMAKDSELPKAGTKAPFVPNPQSSGHVHPALLEYLNAFQRNEDPGQDLIRDSRSTLSADPLNNGDTFTNVHTPSVISSTNEPHSTLFEPMDTRYGGWPQVNPSSFPFGLANVNAPLQTDAMAGVSQGHGGAFLGQGQGQGQGAHLPPPGLSHGAASGTAEDDSSYFQQFFSTQMAALDNNGPNQGWESFLSSFE